MGLMPDALQTVTTSRDAVEQLHPSAEGSTPSVRQ